MSTPRVPTHDDVVITRASADGSYYLSCGGRAHRQRFGPYEWTEVRLAARECVAPGATVWFIDACAPTLATPLDVETGMLIDV